MNLACILLINLDHTLIEGTGDSTDLPWSEPAKERSSRLEKVRVAAVQAAPVWMDRETTIDKVEGLIATAAAEGAGLIVFPEAFVPGPPIWIDTKVPWTEPDEWHARLMDQSVLVPSAATERIGAAAAAANAYVVIGVEERDEHGGTIYCTVLYFDPDGSLLGKHRKLMPTGSERLVWGQGDGSDLQPHDTPFGRVGGLICWENYMPLARTYIYAQGVDIWVAPTLASGDGWVATMRHIAREGRMWVLGVNPCTRFDELPDSFPRLDELGTYREAPEDREDREDREWADPGNTVIVSPNGDLVAGPLRHQEGILYADIDVGLARAERRFFDPVGHYARPDVFRLIADVSPKPVVTEVTFAAPGDDAQI